MTSPPSMDTSFMRPPAPAYRLEGERFVPLPPARSGWDPRLVNGSASAGLLASLLERELRRPGLSPARITIDLMRPIPFAPLEGRVRRVREGRRLGLADAELFHGDELVARASGLFLASSEIPDQAASVEPPPQPSGFPSGRLLPGLSDPGEHPSYQFYCDVRWATAPGAAEPTVWIRPPDVVVEGMPTSDLVRAVATADLLAGLAVAHCRAQDAPVPQAINADVQVAIAAEPRGDFFALRLNRMVSSAGVGFASADLFDEAGYVGRVSQSRVTNRPRR